MEWQVALAVILVVPIVVLPFVLIGYLNVGGIYVAIKQKRSSVFAAIARKMRISLAIVSASGAYGFLVWFFLSRFGWQVALAAGLVLPIVLLIPVVIWAVFASGLSVVIRHRLQQRAPASFTRKARVAERATVRET